MKTLIIEITSKCNLACKGCYRFQEDNKVMDMPISTISMLLDQVEDRKDDIVIIPFFDGEPFLHPQFLDIISEISWRGFQYQISTNGTVKNDKAVELMMSDSGCQVFCVSIDGISGRTVEQLRGIRLEVVDEFVDNVLKIRERVKTKKSPPVLVSLLDMGQDFKEKEHFIEWYLGMGQADGVLIRKQFDSSDTGLYGIPYCKYVEDNIILIKANGDAKLCERNQKSPVIGNVYDDSLDDIVREQKYYGICNTCNQRYNGHGIVGKVKIRGLPKEVYYKQDYFNQVFAKRRIRGIFWE